MIPIQGEVLVQGMTGREGSFHAHQMLEYGTAVVAGVTPGKGGSSVEGIPVYNTVREAVARHPGIAFSSVFVPPSSCFEAVLESLDAELPWVIVITEGMPVKDTLWLVNYAKCKGCRILGPNSPGLIVPEKAKIGIMPSNAFIAGSIGLISRSGTLTYEVANALRVNSYGVSTAIGVGGDGVVGTTILEAAEILETDNATNSIIILGEVGGGMEEELAIAMANGRITKPVVAYIAGLTAPPGKRMGHAGAILSEGSGSAKEKLLRLKSAGAIIAENPLQIPALLKKQ